MLIPDKDARVASLKNKDVFSPIAVENSITTIQLDCLRVALERFIELFAFHQIVSLKGYGKDFLSIILDNHFTVRLHSDNVVGM